MAVRRKVAVRRKPPGISPSVALPNTGRLAPFRFKVPNYLFPLALILLLTLHAHLPHALHAQGLLPGEFGDIQLDRELIEPTRFPTVTALRKAVAQPQIQFVLMLRLHASGNNHHLPVWSHDGQRLAFQRSKIGIDSSHLLLFRTLADADPLLLSDEEAHYDYMFRWGLNHAESYAFARIDQAQRSTLILYSADGKSLVPRTAAGGQSFYPALYERTDGIHWLAYEHDGQLTHQAWQGEESVDRVLLRGSSPRWSSDGRRLLLAKETGRRGEIASYTVAVRSLTDNQELVLNTPPGAVIRSPSWSPQETEAAYFIRPAGDASPWQIQVAPIAAGGTGKTLVDDVVVNASFKSEGPSWEPSGQRIWCFSHKHRQQEYYPLVAAELSGSTTLIDYPKQCTTPNDLAVNPATAIPELALVGHRGPTQDLFILFLNHY